jgi:group I intron endonuclease
MHVYLIQNIVNGKCYVGQHSKNDLYKYWNHTIANALNVINTNRLLYRAIKKYGPECFTIRSLSCPTTKEELNRYEKAYIAFFGTQNPDLGYNLTAGGEGTVGWCPTDEWRENMRQLKTGTKLGPPTEEHKEKVRQSKLGKQRKPFSQECLKNMSASQLGRVTSEETKAKQREASLGKPKSEAHRLAMCKPKPPVSLDRRAEITAKRRLNRIIKLETQNDAYTGGRQ